MLTSLLRRFSHRYSRTVSLVVALLAVQAIANLYLPNLTADIINNGVTPATSTTSGRRARDARHHFGGRGDLGHRGLLGFGSRWASDGTCAAVFRAVQGFSAQDINQFGTPSLITRNTNDIQQIQLFLQMALTMMVLAPIMCVGGVIMALKEDVRLSALLVVAVPVLAGHHFAPVLEAVPLFRSMQSEIDSVNQVLREQITGVRVIRAFVRTSQENSASPRPTRALTNTGFVSTGCSPWPCRR